MIKEKEILIDGHVVILYYRDNYILEKAKIDDTTLCFSAASNCSDEDVAKMIKDFFVNHFHNGENLTAFKGKGIVAKNQTTLWEYKLANDII